MYAFFDHNTKKLKDYLNALPHDQYRNINIKLANHLACSVDVVKNIRSGKTFLRKSIRNKIECFFNQKIF